jgi:hypothetical protein
VFVFTACKKDDEGPKLSNKELLVVHQWKYNAAWIVNGNDLTPVSTEGDCEADNIFDFKENLDLEITTGEQKCYTNEPNTYFTSYELNKNQDTLLMPDAVPVFIRKIELDRMEWQVNVNKEGIDYTLRYELIKN